MLETQQTITDWANETFGPASSLNRILTRANEELAELLKALSTKEPWANCREEAADVAIVLCRAATLTGETISFEKLRELPIAQWPAERYAYECLRCMHHALVNSNGPHAGWWIAELVRNLHLATNRLGGGSLQHAINAKMDINRRREWHVGSDGHGYHKKVTA